jgi:hypothetical protein
MAKSRGKKYAALLVKIVIRGSAYQFILLTKFWLMLFWLLSNAQVWSARESQLQMNVWNQAAVFVRYVALLCNRHQGSSQSYPCITWLSNLDFSNEIGIVSVYSVQYDVYKSISVGSCLWNNNVKDDYKIYSIEPGFPTFFSWRNPSNNFSDPKEHILMKKN